MSTEDRRRPSPAVIPGRLARSISVATRLSLVALLVAMVSLLIAAIVGLRQGSDLADDLIRNRLVTTGASRASQVEGYLTGMQRQTQALALSPETGRIITDLSAAYVDLDQIEPLDEQRQALTDHYGVVVVPELNAVRQRPVGVSELLPTRSAAVHLQAAYVAGYEEGEESPAEGSVNPALIDDAADGSEWTEIHASVHQIYRDIAADAGFDDLYLIDVRNDTIVYSVRKGIDFATSLDVGPLSGSTLAEVVDAAQGAPGDGPAVIVDFARYAAAGDRPVAFLASPVVDDSGQTTGVVAARVATAGLSSIMTNSGDWTGFAESEETYLVNGDATMRSDSRTFIEDPQTYFTSSAETSGLTPANQNAIETFGTTVLIQPVNDRAVRLARTGGDGIEQTTNYLGTEVITAYRPIEVEGLDWFLFTEVGEVELEQPVIDYARNLLVAVAVFLVILTFLVVAWSKRVVEPLRIVSNRLRAVRDQGSADARPDTEVPTDSPTEFMGLADDIDSMLDRLSERQIEVDARSRERSTLLRKFLPPTIARRAEAGERDVLDQSPHATVAVVVLRGLGELIGAQSKEDTRDELDRIVDEVDALARSHGLERMKLTGDSYYAACGTNRPHLDHAPRSVSFSLAVGELLAEIAADTGHELSASAGIDTGPVTVGLTGGARLVYDSWGPTVTTAALLGRMAARNQILVSPATLAQLPASFATTPFDGPTAAAGVAVVTTNSTTEVPS